MNRDLISIIVPVYNVEPYLDRCINSIVSQTYSNLEIILVEDGATDNSGKICDEWEKKDDRIKVIHKENGGLSDARNVGIENAKGDYIAFVDSDDFVKNNMYEVLLKNLKTYHADVSVCSAFDFLDNDDMENCQQDDIKLEYYENEDVFKKLFSKDIGKAVVAWNKLYVKKVFERDLRFSKGKFHEDVFFAHRMLGAIHSIVYTNQKLYYYYVRQGSISNTFNIKRLDELDGMYDRMIFFQQDRFKNTEYPVLSFLAYHDKLIRYYCYLKFYNEKKVYISNMKDIKQKFDSNYNKILESCTSKKKRLKYIFFKKLPNVFYHFNKNRFIKK